MIEVERLDGPKFSYYWPTISRELDGIAEHWDWWWTKESIYGLTMEGHFQCWGAGTPSELKVVVFSKISHFPANTILQIFLAFGNGFDEVAPGLVGAFERFADEAKCTLVEVSGRPGWERKLRKIGFRRMSSILAMKVPEPQRMN